MEKVVYGFIALECCDFELVSVHVLFWVCGRKGDGCVSMQGVGVDVIKNGSERLTIEKGSGIVFFNN